jgi:hypothetical protein
MSAGTKEENWAKRETCFINTYKLLAKVSQLYLALWHCSWQIYQSVKQKEKYTYQEIQSRSELHVNCSETGKYLINTRWRLLRQTSPQAYELPVSSSNGCVITVYSFGTYLKLPGKSFGRCQHPVAPFRYPICGLFKDYLTISYYKLLRHHGWKPE